MQRFDITKPHPQHLHYLPIWQRCRDVIDGTDAVKAGRERYLRRLPGQNTEDYELYLERALFFNMTGKTLDLYLSMIFSKAATVHGVPLDSPLLEDCDMEGTRLEEFLEHVTKEVLSVGRCGVLVDFAGSIEDGMSLADAERGEARPYLARYRAEDIVHWHTGRHRGKTILDRVVLKEALEDDEEDYQYRELILLEERYTVRIWKKLAPEHDQPWQIATTLLPKQHGEALYTIPFYFVDPFAGTPDCAKPPLLDLVDINLGHYRTIADLEHGRLHSGLATPIFAGFNFQEGEQIRLGSTEGIASNLPDAKAYYLEFTGQGLGALEHAAAQKEAWMIQLGAGLIDSYQKTQEAAQTLMIRRSSANASIGRIAMAISETMTKVFASLCAWAGMSTRDIKIQLTTEYLPESVDPQEIAILLQAVQSGNYRRIDWLYRLKSAGIIGQEAKPEKIDEELSGHPLGFRQDAAA